MTTTSAPKPAAPNPTRRVLAISIGLIALLLVGFFVFANLYTDWLWFDQLGFSGVLLTQWLGRTVMFVVGFFAMAIPVWVTIQLAYRLRPVYARLSSQLDRYQEVIEPLRRLGMWGIPIFFGFFAGFTASTQWEVTWTWLNGVPTGNTDPQFGLDTGFYLFAMPFYSDALGFASAVLLICLVLTGVVSYLYGSIRAGQRDGGRWELRISKSARIQIAVLAGLYLLVQAASLFLDRYKTLSEPGNLNNITGPGYAGVNAVIPGQAILAAIAALVAILFFVTAVIGRWRFPLIGTALLIVSALVVGVGYPWAVQQFQVAPNQLNLERDFIQRGLDSTKAAYGINELDRIEQDAVVEPEPGALRADAETTASIRIMDPAIIGPTVRQLEQFRPYYQFSEPMKVDRYEIDGEMQDTIVSVRDLNVDALDNPSWQNQTIVYTHGYGIVAAAGNERTVDGNPVFLEQGIPASGFLTEQDYEPRVYFGESSPTYSIVGAPEGTDPVELDFPRGQDGETDTRTTFSGDGGPAIGGFFNKLLYALKFQSTDILLSDYVNDESQILYDRDPRERVQKAAPYLVLDNDAYPSVVDGRIVWIVDGYTTASTYPYAHTVSLSSAIADSIVGQRTFAIDNINYIRNSVKATVDAYDGSVTLYAWDEDDPVLETWSNIYGNSLEPISEMSGDLLSHVRYPTDLFKVQRSILTQYHVDLAQSFYQADNRWSTPADPVNEQSLQPPYYLTMQMPGQDAPSYSMFTSFIPQGAGTAARNILTGYLAVDANAGNVDGVRSEDYGKLRLIQVNADTTVPGPGQVQNTFNSDTVVSQQINLLRQGQSEVRNGNLLTLPVGGGFLYVQPVFVQASSGTQLPTLQRVLVAFGEDIAFEETLDEALDALFGGDSGASAGDNEVETDPGFTEEPGTGEAPGAGGTIEVDVQVEALLQQAQTIILERDQALQDGDWTAFGAADDRLTQIIDQLITLTGDDGASTTDPAPEGDGGDGGDGGE